MKISSILSILALPLALGACGETQTDNQQKAGAIAGDPAAPTSAQVYSATGKVTELSGNRVTISHGPVEAIGWPAMTMAFKAESPDMVQGVSVGDSVSFQFRQAGGDYVLTTLSKAQ